MSGTLLFIHGTGVREQSFNAALDIIRGEAAAELPRLTVRPCFWGERFGARLHHDGRSIPGYDTARAVAERGFTERSVESVAEAGPLDYEIVLWARLLDDPYFELRLLVGLGMGTAGQVGEGAPIAGTHALPGEELLAAIETLARESPSPIQLAQPRWQQTFDAALPRVARDAEFRELLTALPTRDQDSEQAAARAIVAAAMVAGAAEGLPALDGDRRDAIVGQLVARLSKAERARIVSWLTRPLTGMATRWAAKRRGRLTDAVLEEPFDILLYQARGSAIRAYIREEIARYEDGSVFLFCHSLGGIMAVDLLAQEAIPAVKGLITVGSQAPFLYETGALVSLGPNEPLPAHFPRWLNAYDKSDFLSYLAGKVFNRPAIEGVEQIEDFEVASRQPFPESHSAYFGNATLWRRIAAFVEPRT